MLVKSVASRFFIVAIVTIVTIGTKGVLAVVMAVAEPRHREPWGGSRNDGGLVVSLVWRSYLLVFLLVMWKFTNLATLKDER